MIYKAITSDKTTFTRQTLNELIPITGSLLSGTYGTWPNDTNLKFYTSSHGMFEAVYDYPYLSSSANHIFDLTFGVRSGSLTPVTQSSQKSRIYTQMAQTLLGYDSTGSVKNFVVSGSTVSNYMMFVNFSRLLVKDGVQIGSFTASMGTSSFANPFNGTLVQLSDNRNVDPNTVNIDSPVGQYWYVYTGSSFSEADKVGLLFYQQGVLALDLAKTPFQYLSYSSSAGGIISGSNLYSTGTITQVSDGFRRYVNNLQFLNSVQINSSVYVCDLGLNEFNYSSNPTYISSSIVNTKRSITDNSITYITTVGLYSEDNELLAVAKFSEPLKKTQEDAINLSIRLDY